MAQPPVELGHAIFALHEPHEGHEIAFNRWYERDHMYAGGIMAPWTMAGFRYVATGALKDLRYPESDDGPFGGPSRRGSFLACYWIQRDRLEEQQQWVAGVMADLSGDPARTFEHRDAVSVTTYDYLGGVLRDADGVPAELALDRRYPGLVWTVLERTPETSLADLVRWLLDDHTPNAIEGTLTAMVLAFTPRPKASWWPAAAPEVPGVGDRLVVAHFLDEDPRRVWAPFAGLGHSIDRSGRARTLLVAPFIPTVPGTDKHCDDLW
jgi:hypothetical protein